MINQELQFFLEKKLLSRWDKKIIFNPKMKLSKDFGLEGDDADEFIQQFIEEFNIVLGGKFNFKERFYPEFEEGVVKNIFAPSISIYNFLANRKKTELKDLSIAELEDAINKGFLE